MKVSLKRACLLIFKNYCNLFYVEKPEFFSFEKKEELFKEIIEEFEKVEKLFRGTIEDFMEEGLIRRMNLKRLRNSAKKLLRILRI